MNYIYRRMMGVLLWSTLIQGQPNYLNKLYHHVGASTASAFDPAQEKVPSLELGSIVLYLDNYPSSIKKTVTHRHHLTERTFFIPDIEVKAKEVQDAIARINKNKDAECAITITPTTTPHKGLKISFVYDEKKIGIARHLCDSIQLQKSVVFRLYNNTLINKIQNTARPITHVACNNPPKVIIDCGHGGSDLGAVGLDGIIEKNVSLQVGLQVAQLLKSNNINVCLTRDKDSTVLLDERTAFANHHNADLFISIHANAAPDKRSSGIETFCLQRNLFRSDTSDTMPALLDKQLEKKYEASKKLATAIHHAVVTEIPSYYCVKDRCVQHRVSQVLLGTIMPAILIEIGFVTHEQEARMLAQADYQSFIAQGIVRGINTYLAAQ